LFHARRTQAKFINLSLTALGKCINCLAEGTAHVPYRDSKLTRLMKDSFGGTARTSLIVCVSPLRDHVSETTSALQFGQRAMTITNSTRIREEVIGLTLTLQLQLTPTLTPSRTYHRPRRGWDEPKVDLETL